jgi:ribosomal protein S14
LKIKPDPVVGGWREIENDQTKAEAEERNKRIKCVRCSLCGSSNAIIEKFYDIMGRTTPLAMYVVHCPCGQISKPCTSAFIAAWRWKRLNKKKSKNRQQTACKNIKENAPPHTIELQRKKYDSSDPDNNTPEQKGD